MFFNRSTIDNLPEDTFTAMLFYLGVAQLGRAMAVSKAWRDVISSNILLWNYIDLRFAPKKTLDILPTLLVRSKPANRSTDPLLVLILDITSLTRPGELCRLLEPHRGRIRHFELHYRGAVDSTKKERLLGLFSYPLPKAQYLDLSGILNDNMPPVIFFSNRNIPCFLPTAADIDCRHPDFIRWSSVARFKNGY